jgi:hypothetical protein
MTDELKNQYLDSVAAFAVKHIPEYTALPKEALDALEKVWLVVGENRVEFTTILNSLRPTRKKRVARNS